MTDGDDLRQQMIDAFEGTDCPIDSPTDFVPAPSNGPGTTFESGEFLMTAVELNTKLGGGEFPYDSAEVFVDDVVGQPRTGTSSERRGADRREANGKASRPFFYISGKAFAASAKPLTVRIQRAATVFFSAFAAGPPKVSTGSPLTSWATAFSPTEMSVPLSS